MTTYIYPDGREETYEDQKFSCSKLKELLGGDFHLQYAGFSDRKIDSHGREIETDYWLATIETHGLRIDQLPEYNQAVKEMFNKDVYGLAILAPQSCF